MLDIAAGTIDTENSRRPAGAAAAVQQEAAVPTVHIIAMNLLPEGADRDPIDTAKHETLLAADVLSCRLGNVIG